MDPAAVEQAKIRLCKAERALEALKNATSYQTAEDSWTDFLLASATIYSKLENGSKANGKSKAWYERKKEERKTDPLLQYLHHARNSDQHGLARVVANYKDTGPIWGQQPKFGERIPIVIQVLDPVTNEPIGEKTEGFYSGPTIKLVRVRDRGVFYDLPQTHAGIKISFVEEPLDIGLLCLDYLRNLIAEAMQCADL